MVETLRTEYSVRQICEMLGFTRSNLYYPPKQDPSEVGLRDEIETALRYPTYGYSVSQSSLCVGDTPLGLSVWSPD